MTICTSFWEKQDCRLVSLSGGLLFIYKLCRDRKPKPVPWSGSSLQDIITPARSIKKYNIRSDVGDLMFYEKELFDFRCFIFYFSRTWQFANFKGIIGSFLPLKNMIVKM